MYIYREALVGSSSEKNKNLTTKNKKKCVKKINPIIIILLFNINNNWLSLNILLIEKIYKDKNGLPMIQRFFY